MWTLLALFTNRNIHLGDFYEIHFIYRRMTEMAELLRLFFFFFTRPLGTPRRLQFPEKVE